MAARAKSDTARALWLRVADRLMHAPNAAVLSVFVAIVFIAAQGQPAYATEAPLIGKAPINDLYIVLSAFLSVSLLGCFEMSQSVQILANSTNPGAFKTGCTK